MCVSSSSLIQPPSFFPGDVHQSHEGHVMLCFGRDSCVHILTETCLHLDILDGAVAGLQQDRGGGESL